MRRVQQFELARPQTTPRPHEHRPGEMGRQHLDGDEEGVGAQEALQSGQRPGQLMGLGAAQHDVKVLEVVSCI